jgi:hypothetical protein
VDLSDTRYVFFLPPLISSFDALVVFSGNQANLPATQQNLKAQGREQNLEGQRQEAKGQVSDFASGVGDRVQGTIGSAVTGLTGDQKGQAHYNKMHAEGKTQQRGAEHDIQKQAEAERPPQKQ